MVLTLEFQQSVYEYIESQGFIFPPYSYNRLFNFSDNQTLLLFSQASLVQVKLS